MGMGDDGLAACGLQADESCRFRGRLRGQVGSPHRRSHRDRLCCTKCVSTMNPVGAGLPANEGRNDLPAIWGQNQSSSAFTDLGDSRKLRRLRLTLLR